MWVIEYDRFAMINIADDPKPCAIIIIKDADIPHMEYDNIPASIIPICPIDE